MIFLSSLGIVALFIFFFVVLFFFVLLVLFLGVIWFVLSIFSLLCFVRLVPGLSRLGIVLGDFSFVVVGCGLLSMRIDL